MRLIHFDITNYKRFRDNHGMNLDPSVVCIVGPNEAGKSSFLDAITHLNDNRDFDGSEHTRSAPDGHLLQVRARFLLEPEDRASLEGIPEASGARQVILWKREGYSRGLRLEPAPERDLGPRRDAQARLGALQRHEWLAELEQLHIEEHDNAEPGPASYVDQALTVSGSEAQTLGDEDEIGALRRLLTWLENKQLPHRFRKLPEVLAQVVEYEEQTHPHQRSRDALWPRVPEFLVFGDAERNLAAAYALPEEQDPAIRNLLVLAGTTYAEAAEVGSSGDKGRKNVWLDDIKEALRDRFTTSWGQSDIEVRLDLDGMVLSILMSMQAKDFIEITQRSDGLRQFVALRAYLSVRTGGGVKPILLIDELETHLHYDAQADLIQVLEEQDDVAKVIYTTHSAGCLPRDLGTGIRAIVPSYRQTDEGRIQTDDSEIINKFWTEGRGFSPILIAMGASALAFAATRRAVIGEGMTETMLLPALLREVLSDGSLGYQVAPHFAEASADEVADLDLIAARVAYLVDGDEGGRDHARSLQGRGVLDGQIVHLGGQNSELSLEDLLVKDVYLTAINDELARWHDDLRFDAELPEVGRSRVVSDWCLTQTAADGKPPKLSKVDIAQRVLDQRADRDLVAPSRRAVLRDLDRDIRAVLDRPIASTAAEAGTPTRQS
jgi:AAA domain, putative AbiEii toxin, Type IV TA system/AAA ATPase domain